MREIQIFENAEFGKVRTIVIDNEPWFVGKDIATALGYAKPENAIANHVDEEDKTSTLIQGSGSNYKSKTIVINESGVYSLVFSSKLPTAKAFKRWVTHEVLPAIRKTGSYHASGSYMIDDPIERARAWIREQEERKQYRAVVDFVAPGFRPRSITEKYLPGEMGYPSRCGRNSTQSHCLFTLSSGSCFLCKQKIKIVV